MVPRRIVVAPEWKITLTDQLGTAMTGVTLQRASQDYSLEHSPQVETKSTDADGTVVFPRRVRYAGVAQSFFGCAKQVHRFAYHASCGTHTWVQVRYPAGYGVATEGEYRQSQLNFRGSGDARTDTVVLRKCKNGGTGLGCMEAPRPTPF